MPDHIKHGLTGFSEDISQLRSVQVLAINGSLDNHITVEVAQKTVEGFRNAGLDLTHIMLEGRDHDVWSETLSDMSFYNWLFQH
jgi:hypothetical protein